MHSYFNPDRRPLDEQMANNRRDSLPGKQAMTGNDLAKLCEELGLEPACEPAAPITNPSRPNYRAHLRHVTNELHRKLTGCKTGSSSYKITWGKWLQAQDDLLAYERMAGDESGEGGSLPS